MACVAVLSLMRTMQLEFLQPHLRPILQQQELIVPPNKELIQSLHGKLGSLIELFDENRMDGVEAIKILETRLRDVAFRIEDEIELQVVHLYEEEEEKGRDTQGRSMLRQIVHGTTRKPKTCSPSLTLHYTLQQAIQDIDAIKEGLVNVKEEYELFKHNLQETKAALDVLPKPDEVITMGDSSQHASHSTEIMVGKQDEFQIIKQMLIRHPSKPLEIVSIKGMGGIGKTTLARRVYDDPSIVSHFDKQVWVVASQHHNRLEMLKGLLKSMGCRHNDTEEGLAEQLYRNLIRQRYLVVMDDVWSSEAWNDVKACFPDNGNSSRILLTTRIAEVATLIGSSHEFSHQMHLLNQSESWNLFCKKACNYHGVQFETIGKPIVEKCKGLPLAIIVVAGLFSKLSTLDEWKNTANTLSSSTSTLDDEECLRILSLSYNHLPHNLKACFLYFGVFPEDEEINANNLARLWAAEGLVKQLESLCIYVHGLGCALSDILLLKNLRNVALYHMNSKWKEINVLSKLRRLEVLKLTFSILGKKWELPEGEKFCELICLDIWNVNLEHWNASANQFPKLERLLLRDCQQLREIPNSFAEISTLNLIKLRSYLLSTVMSAKQIQAEQHDYGKDDMVVIVKDTKMHLFDEDDSNEDEFDED